jgi:hypothetical protein
LSIPFEETRKSFVRQWERTSKRFALGAALTDSKLFERSVNLLLAHEDKTYPGAVLIFRRHNRKEVATEIVSGCSIVLLILKARGIDAREELLWLGRTAFDPSFRNSPDC